MRIAGHFSVSVHSPKNTEAPHSLDSGLVWPAAEKLQVKGRKTVSLVRNDRPRVGGSDTQKRTDRQLWLLKRSPFTRVSLLFFEPEPALKVPKRPSLKVELDADKAGRLTRSESSDLGGRENAICL